MSYQQVKHRDVVQQRSKSANATRKNQKIGKEKRGKRRKEKLKREKKTCSKTRTVTHSSYFFYFIKKFYINLRIRVQTTIISYHTGQSKNKGEKTADTIEEREKKTHIGKAKYAESRLDIKRGQVQDKESIISYLN